MGEGGDKIAQDLANCEIPHFPLNKLLEEAEVDCFCVTFLSSQWFTITGRVPAVATTLRTFTIPQWDGCELTTPSSRPCPSTLY